MLERHKATLTELHFEWTPAPESDDEAIEIPDFTEFTALRELMLCRSSFHVSSGSAARMLDRHSTGIQRLIIDCRYHSWNDADEHRELQNELTPADEAWLRMLAEESIARGRSLHGIHQLWFDNDKGGGRRNCTRIEALDREFAPRGFRFTYRDVDKTPGLELDMKVPETD